MAVPLIRAIAGAINYDVIFLMFFWWELAGNNQWKFVRAARSRFDTHDNQELSRFWSR